MAAPSAEVRTTAEDIAQILNEGGIGDCDELHDVFWDYFCNDSSEEEEETYPTELMTDPIESSEDEGYEETFSVIQPPVHLTKVDLTEEGVFSSSAGKPDAKSEKKAECSCKFFNGEPCHERFTQEELLDMRLSHLEMTKEELDLVVLGHISSGLHRDETTRLTKRKEQHERQKVRMTYLYNGHVICRDIFMYTRAVHKYRLTALISHYIENGVTARTHGNKDRIPVHALSFEDKQKVVFFITNYAEAHAVSLPGRIPGYKRDDLKLLPSSCAKASVYDYYASACSVDGTRCVAKRTFLALWRQYLPQILPMKPMSDLCWQCQRNSSLIVRSTNTTDVEKLEAITRARQHIQLATAEREEYKRVVQEAKNAVQSQQVSKLEEPGSNVQDCSRNMLCHYSFDFAQQVHYPSDPMQPGPIYFKTPRKCGVFGVVTETLPQMCLFLLDEAVDTGKGANTVISMLDFFFTNYGLKETTCHLHADNCSGQNKNNAMLQYLLWRVVTGRHQSITLSFLLAGHTKFAPDWCFGLFKRKFRRTKIDCLQDICSAAQASSPGGIIVPQLCGDEAGSVVVPTRNWTSHLNRYFRKLVGLKKYHHFEFHENGEVQIRLSCDSEKEIINLQKGSVDISKDDLPPIIQPAGMSRERQRYLYQEVREFVLEPFQDRVCPKPDEEAEQGAGPSGVEAEPVAGPSGLQAGTPEEMEVEKQKPGRPKKKARSLAAKKN